MKNILLASLIILSTLGFSQTKIYEVPKGQANWAELANGNILVFDSKSNYIVELSSDGTKIQEFEYKHVIKNTSFIAAEFISSPDSKFKYVINPYMISHDNGHILSQLKDGKTIEVFSQLNKDYNLGEIIDVFCDQENLYVHSSEKIDRRKTFSLFAINHNTLEISEVAKKYYSEPDPHLTADAGGVYIGQNDKSVFINFANKPSPDQPQLINTIRQINKSNGTITNHVIKVETEKGDIQLFFDYDKHNYPNHHRLSNRYFTVSSGDYANNFYFNSERGLFEINDETINIIGIIASKKDKKDNITLKEFYSINYSLKSGQQTTRTKLDDYKLFCPFASKAFSNMCFHIEKVDNKIFFERSAPTEMKSKISTFISGEYIDNKYTNISFTESTDNSANIERFKLLGIDTEKFKLSSIDLGNQANPTVFRVYENKSFSFYSIK